MNIIDKYFNFKKKNLISYSLIFCSKNVHKEASGYLDSFFDTYINSYYYHILKTYYDRVVSNFDKSIVVKELKGKRLELFQDNSLKNNTLIDTCYNLSFIAIAIDLLDFSNCNSTEDFNTLLKENIFSGKDNESLNNLTEEVAKNVLKEREFLEKINVPNFSLSYKEIIEDKNRLLVELDYDIEQLSKIYTKPVIDKNFKGNLLGEERNKTFYDLLDIDYLKKILNNEDLKQYFVPLELNYEVTKESLAGLVSTFDNIKVKDYIIFLVEYNDYKNYEEILNHYNNKFTFAISVSLKDVLDVEAILDEIAKFDLFKYVIIRDAKREDYNLIDNYVMKGKEIFINEINMI